MHENIVPSDAPILLTWRDLQPIVRFSRATLDREIAAGRFPRPIKISARKNGWTHADIENWHRARIAGRDARAA